MAEMCNSLRRRRPIVHNATTRQCRFPHGQSRFRQMRTRAQAQMHGLWLSFSPHYYSACTLTYTKSEFVAEWAMPKNEPTLRVDILKRGNPRCSVCGQEFGSDGLARCLIDAFTLHVRRQHQREDASYAVARGTREPRRRAGGRESVPPR